MVVTGQQWLDFCVLVEHNEWADDPDLGIMIKRVMRRAELVAAVDEWCRERTTDEILELPTYCAYRPPPSVRERRFPRWITWCRGTRSSRIRPGFLAAGNSVAPAWYRSARTRTGPRTG
jgi:hypothetical protein